MSYHMGVDWQHYSSDEWTKWFRRIDVTMRGRIQRKIDRLLAHGPVLGMPLIRQLSADLYELRVDKYRLYFTVGENTIWFLAYGDKDSQRRDIQRAQERI